MIDANVLYRYFTLARERLSGTHGDLVKRYATEHGVEGDPLNLSSAHLTPSTPRYFIHSRRDTFRCAAIAAAGNDTHGYNIDETRFYDYDS